jgi:GxxExxY protein
VATIAQGYGAAMPRTFTEASVNEVTGTIIRAAIRIHRALGPGLLENAYLACLCLELTRAGQRFEPQKPLPLIYDGVRVDCAYRADLVVADLVIVEVKALDAIAPVHWRQLRTYTRLADCAVGLLLNFGAPVMKEGIKRVINGFPTGP